MKLLRSAVATVIVVGSAALGAPPVHAAAQITRWDGFLLFAELDAGTTVVDCDGNGNISFSGFTPQPPVLCGEIGQLAFGPSAAAGPRTVDLRAVTPAKFGRVAVQQQSVQAGFGDGTVIYGSAFPDFATTGTNGKIFGNAGNDTLYVAGSTTGAELWGGPGNDDLTALDATTGARLEGGSGNDFITHSGSVGLAAGGDGSDTLTAYNENVSMFGGTGNDTTVTNLAAATGTRVIDSGPGDDRIQVRAQGGVFKARPAVDPQPKVRLTEGAVVAKPERTERAEIRGSGVQTFDIQMDPNTAYLIKPSGRPSNVLTIRVPGGVWTQGATSVTAPGLATVSWVGTPIVTVVAA